MKIFGRKYRLTAKRKALLSRVGYYGIAIAGGAIFWGVCVYGWANGLMM